jgi:hypothetical protein
LIFCCSAIFKFIKLNGIQWESSTYKKYTTKNMEVGVEGNKVPKNGERRKERE